MDANCGTGESQLQNLSSGGWDVPLWAVLSLFLLPMQRLARTWILASLVPETLVAIHTHMFDVFSECLILQ